MRKFLLLITVLAVITACQFEKKQASEAVEGKTIDSVKAFDTHLDSTNLQPISTEPKIEYEGINFLRGYVNQLPSSAKVFDHDLLHERLNNLSGLTYESFIANWQDETVIYLENDIAHFSGCPTANCSDNAYDVFIDLFNDNINIYHFSSNTMHIYKEKEMIELPKLFQDEIDIKKNQANIGNIYSNSSNYQLAPQHYLPESSDSAVADSIAVYLGGVLKSEILKIDEMEREFQYQSFDLNGSGTDDFFVKFTSEYFCSDDLCRVLIINQNGELINTFNLNSTTILASNTQTNGWTDLIIQNNGKQIWYKHDGERYKKSDEVVGEINLEEFTVIFPEQIPIPSYEF